MTYNYTNQSNSLHTYRIETKIVLQLLSESMVLETYTGIFLLSDYIHDNCHPRGRTERFNLYCNPVLKADTFDGLAATCNSMGGQLSWFDTTQELIILFERLWYYPHSEFNDYAYTGT